MNYRQRKYNEGQSARNDIYRFLVKYFEKHGYMPSYEEIMGWNRPHKVYRPETYEAIGDGFSDCHRTSGNIESVPFDGIQIRKEKIWEAN